MKLSKMAVRLALASLAVVSGLSASAQVVNHLVISQVYGGGGSTSSSPTPAYNQDYVEIYNPTPSPVSLSGYSVQYTSAASSAATAGNTVALGNVTLAAGQYYLVGGATSATYTGAALNPAADIQGASLAISATNGNVLLVNSTTSITSCTAATIVDKIGFGTGACYETAASPVLSSTTAAVRTSPCVDTNNNNSDFGAAATSFAPHTTKSALHAACAKLPFTMAPPATIANGASPGVIKVGETDSAGNALTNVSTITLTVTVGATTAYTGTATSTGGVATFDLSGTTFSTAGTYTYTSSGSYYNNGTATETVSAPLPGPATALVVGGFPSPTAQQAAHSFTVTAKDANGNTATGFTGAVSFTSSDSAATLPASYTFTSADAGVHTFTASLATAGTQSITASSSGLTSGSESNLVVTGSVWIVNADSTVSRLNTDGTVLNALGTANTTATAGSIFAIHGVALSVTNTVNGFNYNLPGNGANLITGNGVSGPTSITLDGDGNVWISNGTGNTISTFGESDGGSPTTGYVGLLLSTPSSISVDSTGSVWVTNSGNNSITRFFGAAGPVTTPIVTEVIAGTQAERP